MPQVKVISDPANLTPESTPYSDALQVGPLLFLSGQMGRDPNADSAPPTIEEQTRQAIQNMSRILEAAGASLTNVAAVTIFLADNQHRAGMNAVYREFFGEHKPTRSTIAVGLGRPDVLIEIQAIAVVDG